MEYLFNKQNMNACIRAFVASFIAVFLMVALPYLGFKPQNLISPLPQKAEKVDLLANIRPRLSLKTDSFQLNKEASLALIPSSQAAGDYEQAKAYVVVDFESGQILAEKNSDQKTPIASLTKIMTAVVAMDLGESSDLYTVSEKAAEMIPTKIGVVAGQKITLLELLNALMLTSANDAAQVIKEGINQKYNQDIFTESMNEKAKIVGLKNSHFTNPQGFDNSNHYSSAQDLAILTHYAFLNYPQFTEIVKKEYQFLPADQNHKQFDLYNWNGLLGVYPQVLGVKIGNTDEAGKTTVVLSEREDPQSGLNKKILVVLLGAPGVLERDLWASQLLDLGYEKSLGLKPVGITEEKLKEKYSTWKYFN